MQGAAGSGAAGQGAAGQGAAGQGVHGDMREHRVLPDGCADLLIDLEMARHREAGAMQLVGPMSTAVVVDLRGAVDVIGVRFAPAACGVVTGVPAHTLVDVAAEVPQLPLRLRPCAAALADAGATRDPIAMLFDACGQALLGQPEPDRIVQAAVRRWQRGADAGLPRVSELAAALGIGARTFERRFVEALGMTPAGYRALIRFRQVLARHARGERNWAALAAASGYSDQAHLARNFRAFAGVTPTAWSASQAGIVGFVQDGLISTL
jgi:AraC-like DNA-binding protein